MFRRDGRGREGGGGLRRGGVSQGYYFGYLVSGSILQERRDTFLKLPRTLASGGRGGGGGDGRGWGWGEGVVEGRGDGTDGCETQF